MIYPYKKILLSKKNEWTIDMHNTYKFPKKTLMLNEEIRKNAAYMISYIYTSRKLKLIYTDRK